ncbi:interaptin-like [Watersipora subatra]|uniref:interaptin-like n=1 Tax=Watersipora subatra TaxID=2589382 RepID=UPI00355C053F
MEKTLDQAKDEISRLEMAVQQERTKATKCQQQIDTLTQKLAGSQSHAKDVASEVKNLQDLLAECRANVTLKSEEVKKMGKEAKNMVAKIEDTEREVIHREELIDRLTNEISTLQQEMARSHDKLADYETNTKKLRSKMEQRTAECSNSDDRYRALHQEFLAYKEQHQYDNQEINEKDERLRQLEDELQGTSIDLSEKNRQLLAIREEQAIQKSSIGCLQDKMAEAEGEVSRLELTLKETREELDKTRQSFHSEKQEEVNSLGEQVRLLRVDVADREKREAYAQNLISQLHIDVDRVKADITESRAECKGYAQELAHHEEKRLLLEQTLLTTKDQLKQRVTDNVKQEQTISRLQTDMTAVQDQNVQLEHEYGEVKQLVDRLECELNAKTKERDNALEKESSTKLSLQRVQNDLVQSEDRYRRLDAKYVELDGKLQDSHTEHMKEQQRCRELDRLLTNYKSVITELQDDVEQLTKQHKTAADNVKDRESLLKRRCDELDSLTAKLMVTKESLVEKEGQLRIALINLETCEREKGSALQRLEHCETDYHQTAEQRDHLHEQLKQLEAAAREKDRELSRIKSDISSLQSNLNETIDQLNEKSRLTKELKSQLNQSEKLNQELGDEVATLEKKVKSMKHDIKKLQEYNSAAKTDLEKYEQQFRLMHDEVQGQTDRNKQAVEELALKEEELVVAKVEAATLSERLSSKCQDLERTEEELRSVRNSHRVATEEVQALQNALDDARSNGDRLHKESEQVVRNVNGWVDEQKRANEKLASKLREQSDTIRHLQSEKKTLTEDLQSAVNKTRQLEALNAELRTEQLKLQSLQDHSSRQQTLLRQLQQKLEEYEQAQDADLQSKLATIDDLQRQLQINTDNSNLLNSQISMLQKQNSQIRADLEREVANRHTLEATIDQKDDMIRTLRGQSASLRGSISTRTRSPTRARSPSRNGSINEDSTSSLDKSYWIQRVGELSMQLQQSSEYWSEKVGNLQAQLENK